jgi:penicillin-binding protein 2
MGIFTRRRRWRSEKRRTSAAARGGGRRPIALYAVILLAFSALSVRLLYMQVIGGSAYRLRAEDNRIQVEISPPNRGLIFDRAGRQLVTNVGVWSVNIVPAELTREREREVFDALQNLLGVPSYKIEQKVAEVRQSPDPYQRVAIKGEIDHETALILRVRSRRGELPGVHAEWQPTRVYKEGDVLAHVLGYTGRITADEVDEYKGKNYTLEERVGKAGVELSYEAALHGSPGRKQVEVDATGREVRTIAEEAAKDGQSITLSIDADLQKAVHQILADSVAGQESRKAVALMMDVHTGEILANVSLPTFNSNMFSYEVDEEAYAKLLADKNKPLLDHSVAEKFAPGSTFKQITGIAALQEGVATTKTTIVSKGALLVPRDYDESIKDSFPDWNPNLGTLDFYRGVAMSSDVYFYCLAGGHCPQFGLKDGVGSERLARYARMFGLGELTGVDLPNETEGLVGDAEWLSRVSKGEQQWYTGDTFFMGIGQGYIETSPLQLLRVTATIANGGLLLKPRVVREVRDSDGTVVKPNTPEVVRRVSVDAKNLQIMRDAMRMAVTEGTADKTAVPGVAIAAKTGTAEFGESLGAGYTYGTYKTHGWVVAFGPYENPEVAVVVFQEQGSGATTAAPTASKILNYYFNQRPRLTRAVP